MEWNEFRAGVGVGVLIGFTLGAVLTLMWIFMCAHWSRRPHPDVTVSTRADPDLTQHQCSVCTPAPHIHCWTRR